MTPPGSALPPKRILIVEDDFMAALSLRLALNVDGYDVEIAASAEQAVNMFESSGFDLIIADFKLPKMDGLELAEVIKQRAPSCPIILVTAYAETVQSRMGEVSNVDVLLGKPVCLAKLHEALRKLSFVPVAGLHS